MKIKREVKIGIIVTVALALLFWGFNFLRGKNVFTSQREFYAIYEQIDGLTEANPVLVNGFKVGQVDKMYFLSPTNGKIVVRIAMYNEINIPKNTIAKIVSSDLLGSKAIELKLGNSTSFANSGDTLLSGIQGSLQDEVSKQILPFKKKAESLLLSMDSVMAVIQYVFNKETRDNLAKSFENIKFTLDNLKHFTYNIDTLVSTQKNRLAAIIGNVESLTRNLKDNNQKITTILNNFSAISDSLAKANISKTIKKADNALEQFSQITNKINNGTGSISLLLNNDSLYNNLKSASKELDELLLDVKLHPKRYVHFSLFGKSSKKDPYKAPDKEKK
ncbi:MAG: MCE family protein [Bacteroidetes bacterium]|nr:MCE family protein [Bacteroidota bacterium]